ncbi:transporter [Lentzea sp. NBRC 105346]|uniref:PH-like domain-containing protein n=1 Tax=Lentzea sp. NBRC 105346 TaxID=3032205 RepID=UPI0024A0551E|nr:transporter [Lentzea sp. NBRC 105346]GLZ35927.1 transporter [Lentzea sp. NBRC 105346]
MTRVLLVLIVFLFFALCVYGMWHGWRRRARKQAESLPAFPAKPEQLGDEILNATGVYIGTTNAGNWQDRIQVGDIGHRAEAELHLHPEGVAIERVGADDLFIPKTAIKDVRTDKGLAGKVMFDEGLLVIQWELEDRVLDTGFRGDDKSVYGQWVDALVGGKA